MANANNASEAPQPKQRRIYLFAELENYDAQRPISNLFDILQSSSFYCCDSARSLHSSSGPVDPSSGRVRLKEQRLPFSVIQDLFKGKKTSVFKHVSNSSVAAHCCLSFGGPKAMVSLQAENQQIRDEWINGLKQVLSATPNILDGYSYVTTATLTPSPVAVVVATPTPIAPVAHVAHVSTSLNSPQHSQYTSLFDNDQSQSRIEDARLSALRHDCQVLQQQLNELHSAHAIDQERQRQVDGDRWRDKLEFAQSQYQKMYAELQEKEEFLAQAQGQQHIYTFK